MLKRTLKKPYALILAFCFLLTSLFACILPGIQFSAKAETLPDGGNIVNLSDIEAYKTIFYAMQLPADTESATYTLSFYYNYGETNVLPDSLVISAGFSSDKWKNEVTKKSDANYIAPVEDSEYRKLTFTFTEKKVENITNNWNFRLRFYADGADVKGLSLYGFELYKNGDTTKNLFRDPTHAAGKADDYFTVDEKTLGVGDYRIMNAAGTASGVKSFTPCNGIEDFKEETEGGENPGSGAGNIVNLNDIEAYKTIFYAMQLPADTESATYTLSFYYNYGETNVLPDSLVISAGFSSDKWKDEAESKSEISVVPVKHPEYRKLTFIFTGKTVENITNNWNFRIRFRADGADVKGLSLYGFELYKNEDTTNLFRDPTHVEKKADDYFTVDEKTLGAGDYRIMFADDYSSGVKSFTPCNGIEDFKEETGGGEDPDPGEELEPSDEPGDRCILYHGGDEQGVEPTRFFSHRVLLEPETVYVYEVYSKNGSPEIRYSRTKDWAQKMDLTDVEISSDSYFSVYEFTTPSLNTANIMTEGEKVVINVGVRFNLDAESWHCGFKVYKKGDAEKTNLLSNPDFWSGFSGWCHSDYAAPVTGSKVGATVRKQLKDLEGFGTEFDTAEEFFAVKNPIGDVMIKTKAKGSGFTNLGQWMNLKPGTKYKFSLYHAKEKRETDNFESTTWAMYLESFVGDSKNRLYGEMSYDPDYLHSTMIFTIPDPSPVPLNADGTVKCMIGMNIGNETEVYQYTYGWELYELDAEGNVTGGNMFKNIDMKLGFYGWAAPKNAWANETELFGMQSIGAGAEAELVPLDMNVFKRPNGPDLEGEQMVWVKGDYAGCDFGQWVDLEKGKTYEVSLYYRFLNGSDMFPTFQYQMPDFVTRVDFYAETFDDSEPGFYKSTFKVPDEAPENADGKVSVFVRIHFNRKQEGYFYKFNLTEQGKTASLFRNKDFKQGLYGWSGNDVYAGLYELSKGLTEFPFPGAISQAKLYPYDPLLMLAYDNESYFDDGTDWADEFATSGNGDGDGNETDENSDTGIHFPFVPVALITLVALGLAVFTVKRKRTAGTDV